MSEYSSLKATINASVKTNGNQEITGEIMNSVLNAMVNSLGAGYQYMGVATPSNPGTAQTPDYKCFYIAATPGTYTNLGGLVVADGEVAILKYDSTWHKDVTGAATAAQLTELGQTYSDFYKSEIPFIKGAYIATNVGIGNVVDIDNPTSAPSYKYAVVELDEGDGVYVSGAGGGAPRLWAFLDAQKKLIDSAESSESRNNWLLFAPINSKYLVINTSDDKKSYYAKKDSFIFQKADREEIALYLLEDGYYYDNRYAVVSLSKIRNNYTCASIIPVAEGELYHIIGATGKSQRLWSVTDNSGNRIGEYVADASATDDFVRIPSGGTLLIVNSLISTAHRVAKVIDNTPADFVKYNNTDTNISSDNVGGAITELSYDVMGHPIVWHNNSHINTDSDPMTGTIEPDNYGISCAAVDVEEGENYIVTGKGSAHFQLYKVTDENGNVLLSCPYEECLAAKFSHRVIIPKGGKKLFVNVTVAADRQLYRTVPVQRASSLKLVAASNSSEHDKAVADYICSGVKDQEAINAAIKSLTYGGTIQLLSGDYIIDDFSRSDGVYPCAIEMMDNGNARFVTIQGIKPTYPSMSKPTRLLVDDACYAGLDNNNQVAVISQGPSSRQNAYWFNNAMYFKDFSIELPDCTKPVICINQLSLVYSGCEGVVCYSRTSVDFFLSVANGTWDGVSTCPEPNEKSIAFSGISANNTSIYMRYWECTACGFGVGFDIGGDHITMINCGSQRNLCGYRLGEVSACYHHITLINCCSETDVRFMYFGSKNTTERMPVVIQNFQMEVNQNNLLVPGGRTPVLCEEANFPRINWVGEISYSCTPSNIPFFVNGHGKGFTVRNLRDKLSGPYADRPASPNQMQQYYDTDNDRMLLYYGEDWKVL